MRQPPVIKTAILAELERAGANGLTLPELCVLLPRYSYRTLAGVLSLLRGAGRVLTLRQARVAVHFRAELPLDACRAAFARHVAQRAAEAHSARQALLADNATAAARLRREQQMANRTARAIKGDGTYQPPAKRRAAPPPPSAPGLDGVAITRCTSWQPRWAVTEPIQSLPIGQYDTPPSPWAAAVTNRTA